jgi:monovalent cation:H+ antiporter, CPA1 family
VDLFHILAIIITLTAIFSYVNHRYFKLPVTIGVMTISLILSLFLIFLSRIIPGLEESAQLLLDNINFDETLLKGMLSFLLFAGALNVNLQDLAERKYSITCLATAGTIISVFIVGSVTWLLLRLFNVNLSLIYCLLFGAVISPTDPVAVLSILKTTNAPKSLESKITGESLFNDGIGVVIFLTILEAVSGAHELSTGHILSLFAQEAVGGIIMGLVVGYLAFLMLKSVDNYQVEILITLALTTGGYALADLLHISGPIAIVVAGLLVGNHGRLLAMSEKTRHHLDIFWELVDEILNAVLFVMIGMEILVLTFQHEYLLLCVIIIPVVLFARLVSISVPIKLLSFFRTFTPGVIRIMTWGGLRGGISVALALSIPESPERQLILALTYSVVLFSILVQGLTIERLVKKLT